MITEIVKTNNQSLIIDNTELLENICYGQFWVNIKYKDGVEQFIPNVQISTVLRRERL